MTDFYVTGIDVALDNGDAAVQVGEVGIDLENLLAARDEDVEALREFEDLSGITPQVFRLVPLGSIWDFDALDNVSE